MNTIGFISETFIKEKLFNITTTDGELLQLCLENCNNQHFVIGDVLEFEVLTLSKSIKKVINPKRISNKIIDELTDKCKNDEFITAYVYHRNESGYDVSYKGFHCFLPIKECTYKTIVEPDEPFLNGMYEFSVRNISNTNLVVLSRKPFLKNQFIISNNTEIEILSDGNNYIGFVSEVRVFGIFITYKYSTGLLHISKILDNYESHYNKENQLETEALLKEVFIKDRNVSVYIESIKDDKYSLNWDKTLELNTEICNELLEKGLMVTQ